MKTRILIASLAIALIGAASTPVLAQVCGDAERQQFQDAVDSGVSWDELQAFFAVCADDGQSPLLSKSKDAGATQKVIQKINTGSVYYEQMNGCGYNPQSKEVACDVEVKRNTYYGPFPTGSQEFVRFCFACNTTSLNPPMFDSTFLGAVHVTDDNQSGGTPSYYFTASSRTWPGPSPCPNNDGNAMTVRAILSWYTPVPDCTSSPIWGNQFTFTVRRDP